MHAGLVDDLIGSGELDPPTLNEMHARILSIPYTLMRYMEGEDIAVTESVEKTTDGTLFTRLRDNQLLISTLRLIRQRTFGYAREHFLAYFGKVFFIDTANPASEQSGDKILGDARYSRFVRVWLGAYLSIHPMVLREPADYLHMISSRFNGAPETQSF